MTDTRRRIADSGREIILGIVVTILGTLLVKYADLPTRMAVIETRQDGFKEQLSSMDAKLDKILFRMKR